MGAIAMKIDFLSWLELILWWKWQTLKWVLYIFYKITLFSNDVVLYRYSSYDTDFIFTTILFITKFNYTDNIVLDNHINNPVSN